MSALAIVLVAIGVIALVALAVSYGRRVASARAAKLGHRRVEAADHRSQASGHAQRAEQLHQDSVEHRERAEHHLERADELDALAEQHAREAGAEAHVAARVEPT